nr:hypothetical protein [Tanacetum cinerariifolium]
MGIVPTEMELILEQTQQGISDEVLVDPHGFAGYLKMEVKRRSVKVKEIQERCIIKALQVIKSRK